MCARELRVRLPGGRQQEYAIRIGAGLMDEVGTGIDRAGWVLATDENVAPLYAERVQRALERADRPVVTVVLDAGESAKSRESVAAVQDRALEAGAGRDWAIVALGGGVVGDLAGYAAATLHRGIPCVQVPTSLLAMVDSAVGGKTGVNVAAGKNLVGAFWQPAAVWVDVDTLATLPERELRAGLAEVVKYAVILDEELFVELDDGLLESCLARVPEALASVVERCLRLKAEVVARDEREAGPREILNFGHTVAHGIERASGYAMLHGEAVAIGMVLEARLAEAEGVSEAGLSGLIAELCARAGLPVALPPGIAPTAVVEAARHDKKVRGGRLRCVLPERVGVVPNDGRAVQVEKAALLAALD